MKAAIVTRGWPRTKGAVVLFGAIALLATPVWSQSAPADPQREHRLQWWREARFGMFIHWGIYSVAAGEWQGRPVPDAGEWIMNKAKIPATDYARLAGQFNPVKFNAQEWVRLAKDGGMKYIVITAKHHDGFAMYGSKVSPYNIVDATPFHRDPMKELAAACRQAGLKLCFYYSHVIDWHEPDAVGNDWDFPAANRNFTRYFEQKAKPQVRELLGNYGPIGAIWFDVWFDSAMTKAQAREMEELVHGLQPDCLVNGRVGYGLGDYDEADDNQITVGNVQRDWETPVTMNDTWGFKKDDHNWKSIPVLIQQLVRIASNGGNYLLNVGPTAEGQIPQPSVERLQAVGRWLRTNAESVRGTRPSPFAGSMDWGLVTARPGRLYLHLFDWPAKELQVYGIQSRVRRAYLLADPGRKPLVLKQESNPATGFYATSLHLPSGAPDPQDSVVVLELPRQAEYVRSIIQQPDGAVSLAAHQAEVHQAPSNSTIAIHPRDFTEHWTNPEDWLSWSFKLFRPGLYEVIVLTTSDPGPLWKGGREVLVEVNGTVLRGRLTNDGKQVEPSNPYMTYVLSKIGQVRIERARDCRLSLKSQSGQPDKETGLRVASVRLVPAEPPAPTPESASPGQALREPPQGFTRLFNGTDLTGWCGPGRPDMTVHWAVTNGELVSYGHGIYASTEKDYGDFELLAEYKTVPKADSGIFLRGCPQVRIWDCADPGKVPLGAAKGSGGLSHNSPGAPGKDPLMRADKPLGQWNSIRVLMVGARVSVWLNDKLVVDHASLQNYYDHKLPVPPKGPLQLLTQGGEMRWRNLFIREIGSDEADRILASHGDEGFQSIFNGRDFEGWAGPTNEYMVVDGAFLCRPNKGNTVYTTEEYSDFTARMEIKLPPGGNNGLAIRYPGYGDTAYVGMCELQVLDDHYEKATGQNIDPRQAHGSAYGMVAAARGYQHPIGEWNFEEVTIKGSKIKVELNGTVILDCDLATVSEFLGNHPHPGKDRTKGYFGFAGHDDPVAFRNIRIKKL